MEGEPSSPEVLSAVFDKKKKKRRQLDSLGKGSPEPLAPAGLGDPARGSKRKKRESPPWPLPLPEAELSPHATGPLSKPPHKKKRKRSALGVDAETGVAYVLVDREDSENVPENFRKDVDVVYVDVNRAWRAIAESGAREPLAVESPPQEEPERPRAKKKMKKRPCGMVPGSPRFVPRDSDGVQDSPRGTPHRASLGVMPESPRTPRDSDGVQDSPRATPHRASLGVVPESPRTPRDSDGVQDSPRGTPHRASLGVVPESPCTPRDRDRVQDSPRGTLHHTSRSEVWASPCTPSPLQLGGPCVPPALPERGDRKKAKKKKKRRLGSPDSVTPAAIPPEPVGSRSQEDGPVAGKEEPGEGGRKKTEKRKPRAPGDGPAGPAAARSPRHPLLEPEEGLKTTELERAGPGPGRESLETEEEQPRLKLTDQSRSSVECARDAESRPLSEGPQDSGDSDVDLGSTVDLGLAVKQLQEFIPDIKDRAATTIRRMYRDDLVRFQEFKAQGVAIKFGKFSVKENKQLEQNVHEFLALTGIESADKLLYTDRYPEEKSAITDLKRKFSFRVHIGKGIARPWKLVYYRAKKMFDVNNYKGRYSQGEVEKLKACHSLHGNNWKKIGEMVARSSLSVALKYSQISSARNRGAWSRTETQKLTKAVEEVILRKLSPQELAEVDSKLEESPERRLSIVREKLYKGISWVEVAACVGTRSWMQCKSKWMEILTRRMTNGQRVYRGVNALQAKVNLIERLYEVNVEDANEIDWEDLAGAIGDVPPSYVQTKFYKLKATCVPFWQKKMFPEIIDHLYEVTLPLLKEKLQKVLEKRGAGVQTPAAPKQAFLFRDIFCAEDSEGEEESERS